MSLAIAGCAATPPRAPATPAVVVVPPAVSATPATPEETCASLVARGIAAEGEGALDRARAAYTEALDRDRRCVPALIDLARLDRRADPGSVAAERQLARALELDGRSLEALDQLALVHLERGQLELADGVIDRAISIDPDRAIAHEARAIVAMRRGDVHAALAALDLAIELAPSFEARMNRAGLKIEIRDHEGAELDYRTAVELRPGSYEAWLGLGVALRGLAWIEQARAAFERALAIDPDRAEAHYDLGVLYADWMSGTRQQWTTAHEHFRQFVLRASGQPELAVHFEDVARECGCEAVCGVRWRRRRARDSGITCVPGRMERISCSCGGLEPELRQMQRDAEAMQRQIEAQTRRPPPSPAVADEPAQGVGPAGIEAR